MKDRSPHSEAEPRPAHQKQALPSLPLSALPAHQRLDLLNRRAAARLYQKTSLKMGRPVPPEITALAQQEFWDIPGGAASPTTLSEEVPAAGAKKSLREQVRILLFP